ncbi:MAG: cupin domain-containing protein [Aureliella sp.]
MKRVFPIPPPIVVPDGTKLSEIVGSRVLSELGERVSDGVSVALGTLPGGTVSKVHVHPVVWHFTWVLTGELTVKMKDTLSDEPYELVVPTENGVLTEQGTFFQLINSGDEECKVLYIVGPGFVFELGDPGVRYNDAVVFEEDWDELKELNWIPHSLPSYQTQFGARNESLRRLAASNPLEAVHGERWGLLSRPGGVEVPSPLHNFLVMQTSGDPSKPSEAERTGIPSDSVVNLVEQFLTFLHESIGLETNESFKERRIKEIVRLKCNERPSYLAEYELALNCFQVTTQFIHQKDIWLLLLLGTHDDVDAAGDASLISRVRRFVLHELLEYTVSIGGGFQSAGAMENYRAFMGGIYSDPESYRHYNIL